MEYKNIIIRMPNWIGDIVMATPVISDIRDRYRDSKITVMCQKKDLGLLENDKNIDSMLSFEKKGGRISKEVVQKVKEGRYDLGILLTNSLSSALFFYFGRVSEKIGYGGNFRSFFLDVVLKRSKEVEHLVVTYKRILKEGLGIEVSKRGPKLFLDGKIDYKALLRSYGVRGKRVVGINALARYGEAKCWPPERFLELAKRLLQDPDLYILFFGEREAFSFIKRLCMYLDFRAINLAGKTDIKELMGLINECDLFLSNDSGPMHIADALGVEVIAIFGSTSDKITGPFSGEVVKREVECSPCFKRRCMGDFRCMNLIGVDEVFERVEKALYVQKDKEKIF